MRHGNMPELIVTYTSDGTTAKARWKHNGQDREVVCSPDDPKVIKEAILRTIKDNIILIEINGSSKTNNQ